MSLKTKSVTVENVTITSTEMGFCDATDLLADLLPMVAPAGGDFHGGMAHAGDTVGRIAREVAGGALARYLTRVLATTTIVVKGEVKVDMLDSREKLDQAFSGRKKFVFPAVKLALEVSFKDFLDGLELIGVKLPKIPTPSPSETSSQSTSATG